MLVDEEDGDILALCELLESGLDGGDLCFWKRAMGSQAAG